MGGGEANPTPTAIPPILPRSRQVSGDLLRETKSRRAKFESQQRRPRGSRGARLEGCWPGLPFGEVPIKHGSSAPAREIAPGELLQGSGTRSSEDASRETLASSAAGESGSLPEGSPCCSCPGRRRGFLPPFNFLYFDRFTESHCNRSTDSYAKTSP